MPSPLPRILLDPLRALAFLSRIPVGAAIFDGEEPGATSRYAWAFPLAGLVIAIPSCIVLWLLIPVEHGYTPDAVSCALAIITMIFVTGALHEDGLADVADGFWGGHTRERRLQIMKDSSIGTYGALALVASLLLRTLALAFIVGFRDDTAGAIALAVAAGGSRAMMTVHWALLPSARSGGVADKAGQPSKQAMFLTVLIAAAIMIAIAAPLFQWGILLAALTMVVVTLIFTVICKAKIAGHTGDTIGATQQLNEMAILIALAFAT